MLETIKQRINAFIKYKGITIKSFEEKCGLSNGYYLQCERDLVLVN